jgi:dTDP-4-dehydrorhamnose reductase
VKLLILGANGQVGWELQRSLAPIGELVACDRRKADLAKPESLRAILHQHRPDVIVNAAAYTAVDKAESDEETARRINTDAVAVLAEEAKSSNAWLVHYSTDYVFDGSKAGMYEETDATDPLNVYGTTKRNGEQAIRNSACDYFIFRTGWVYADRGNNFIKKILKLASERDELSVVADQTGAPTHAALIADVTAHAIHQSMSDLSGSRRDLSGIYHLSAAGETNWHAYASYVLKLAVKAGMTIKVDPEAVEAIPSAAYQVAAVRPKNSLLNCDKLERRFNLVMPNWTLQVARTIGMLVE